MIISDYNNIGDYFRDIRESQQITIEQSAKILNIRSKYLIAIEAGTIDEILSSTYVKGYIKNYAEFLGVSPNEALKLYNNIGTKNEDFFIPDIKLKPSTPSNKILYFSAIGILAIYLYWYNYIYEKPNIENIPQPIYSYMDKKWQDCLDGGEVICFINLRNNNVEKTRNITSY